MAKNEKAVYAPGELGRVREKLGNFDHEEAKRLANALGGEVGYERSEEQEQARSKPKNVRYERVDVKIGNQPGRTPRRRVELAADEDENQEKYKTKKQKANNPADDPSIILKPNYWERVRMDKYAGQSQFEIKSATQVLFSMFSVFGDIPDYINPTFITRRMREYYRQMEILVVSTRSLFPRNNMKRNERIRKTAPLVFIILNTIRNWDIEKISGELAKLQANPKNVKLEDFAEILRDVYKPIFVLDRLDMDAHIRGAFKILYKALYIENPIDAQSKCQDMIRAALTAFGDVRRDIRYLLYPLLMKTISAQWVPYESFFVQRKKRFMAFLKANEDDQIDPAFTIPQAKTDAEPETETDADSDDADAVIPEEITAEKAEEEEEKPLETSEEKAVRVTA
jgi:hypothetical protein